MNIKHYPLLLAIPFVLISVIFILGITFGIPLGDEWVWTKKLLIPFSQGELKFSKYMLGEYSFLAHSHYLALLFLLADYHWFNLDYSYFAYIGIVFFVLGYIALLVYVKQFFRGDLVCDSAAVIVMSAGYFCMTSDFPWLLVVFEYVYFFLAIALLIGFDLFVREKISFIKLLILVLVTLVFGDTIGMAAVFVGVPVLLIYGVKSSKNLKYFVMLTALLSVFFALQYMLLGQGVPSGGHSRLATLRALLHAPADVLISFMSIFSQSLVDITIFRYLVGEKTAPLLQFGLGILGFVLVSSVVFAYFYYQGWKKSWLPMMLIGFGLLSWLLIFLSRYLDFGVYAMDEPRYVRLFTLLYVGCGVALLCIHTHLLAKRFYLGAAAVLLSIYIGSVFYKFWQDQYIESYFANTRIELQKDKVDSGELSKYIGRCANDYCLTTIEFMKNNQLSIYKK